MYSMDIRWAYQQMDFDRFFRNQNPAEKERLIAKALRFSSDMADQFADRFGTNYSFSSLEHAAMDLGSGITILSRPTLCPFLSDFDPNKRQITLYTHNIETFYIMIEKDFADCFQKYRLNEMCILHELCHVMEFIQFGEVGKLAGVGEKKAIMKKPHEYRRLSEVAAHAFVQQLMRLPVSPAVFGMSPSRSPSN